MSEDSDAMDSDDEETSNDSNYESDEESARIVENNVNRFEIKIQSNMPLWERIETEKDEIATKQGKNSCNLC